MIFFIYCYMVAMAFATSAGCAYYAYQLGRLKTTYTGPWFTMAIGFAFAFVYEVFRLYFFWDILNFLYEFRVEELLTLQILETLKYTLPLVALAIMFKRRERQESS